MNGVGVYGELRDAIARGELEPESPLVESELMRKYAAGRPAVRTALVRLEQDGLVERVKNRSARVRLLTPGEAVEIYRARTLLEAYAVAKTAVRATADDVAELRVLLASTEVHLREGRLSAAAVGDTAFHKRVLDLAGDGTITRLHGTLHGELLRFRHRSQFEHAASRGSATEHRAILEAIATGDADGASLAMRRHLERLTDVLREVLA